MSADAEMVPVAWLYEREESCAGPFEARHVRISIDRSGPYRGETETPLYSADTIAALRKGAERYARLRGLLLSRHDVRLQAPGKVPLPVNMLPFLNSAEFDAAIDAAQSTEGER